MANFVIDFGHLFDSLKRTCRRYSNQNRPSCVQLNPSEITGLPYGGFPDGVNVIDGHITMPELPGIGFEGKSDLIKVMRQLAE